MEEETIDLRSLLLMVKEKKPMNANYALEFDCVINSDDVNTLVKVINYALNYINHVTNQQIQVSLNASLSGILMGFTAFTNVSQFPPLNIQVADALKQYNAVIEQKGQPGNYAQLLVTFSNN